MAAKTAALALLALVSLAGCKKHAKPTLPLMSGCNPMATGGNDEGPDATRLHTLLRCTDTVQAIRSFYRDELVTRRGWTQAGDQFSQNDNLEHQGTVGRDGSIAVKDPSQPGGWVAVAELPNYVEVDLWESIPRAK